MPFGYGGSGIEDYLRGLQNQDKKSAHSMAKASVRREHFHSPTGTANAPMYAPVSNSTYHDRQLPAPIQSRCPTSSTSSNVAQSNSVHQFPQHPSGGNLYHLGSSMPQHLASCPHSVNNDQSSPFQEQSFLPSASALVSRQDPHTFDTHYGIENGSLSIPSMCNPHSRSSYAEQPLIPVPSSGSDVCQNRYSAQQASGFFYDVHPERPTTYETSLPSITSTSRVPVHDTLSQEESSMSSSNSCHPGVHHPTPRLR